MQDSITRSSPNFGRVWWRLPAEERFLEAVIDLCKEQGWLKARGRQRTDSTHIEASVRALNRAECVVETLRHALNVLAVVAPDWLGNQVQPEWLERYGHRAEEYRLPSGEDKRHQFLHQVGQDGLGLLAAIQAEPTLEWMLSIPAVDTDTSDLETRLHASRQGRELDS
jgi:transposase